MTEKNIHFYSDAQDKLIRGAKTLSDAVSSTLGPMGSTVAVEVKYGDVVVTKDGVTVAKHIVLTDPVENIAASLIKQAAINTAKIAGDGTTTTTLLAYNLAKQAVNLIKSGYSPREIKEEWEILAKNLKRKIKDTSVKITADNVEPIARTSSNSDIEITKAVSEAFKFTGEQGTIAIEESKTVDGITVENISGVTINRGFLSPFFINNKANRTCEFKNPLVLITDQKISAVAEIKPALEASYSARRPLLIIADSVEQQALSTILYNVLNTGFSACVISAPGFGSRRHELLTDLAIMTGANLISQTAGILLEDLVAEDLGEIEAVTITESSTSMIGLANSLENSQDLKDRVESILKELDGGPDSYTVKMLEQRLGNLQGKAAKIIVGAHTPSDLKEKKDRIEDAVRACKSALALGIVPGAFTSYIKSLENPTKKIHAAFNTAIMDSASKLFDNANLPSQVIVQTLYTENNNLGFNILNNAFEDLIQSGIIDPSLVVIKSIENALSAATMIYYSPVVLTEVNRTPAHNPGNLEDYEGEP
jgi:chaperonin GroEL